MANIDELRARFYDDDDDSLPRRGAHQPQPRAGPSFIDRARNAPDPDDFQVPNHAPMNVDNDVIPGLFADPSQLPKESDLQELLRLWQNERHAPEILPSNGDLLSRVLDQIRRQVGS